MTWLPLDYPRLNAASRSRGAGGVGSAARLLTVPIAALFACAACHSTTSPGGGGPGSAIWTAQPDANWQPAADDSAVYFKTREHVVVSVSRLTGTLRWSAPTHATTSIIYGTNALIVGKLVIVPDYAVYAFDRLTGALVWSFNPEQQGLAGYAPGAFAISSDGATIFSGSGSGHAYAIDASTGSLRWVTQIASDGNSSVFDPVLDDSTVYVRVTHFTNPATGELVALDKTSGAILWSRAFAPTVQSASDLRGVAVYGQSIIVSVDDGTIRAVDKTTGAERWTAPRPSDVSARDDARVIIVAGDVVVAGSETFDVTGYDAGTGQQLWRTNAGQGSSISPLATDGHSVYVVYANGVMGALDSHTGNLRWLAHAPSGWFGFGPYPLATSNAVFAPSASGLIALRP